MVVHMCFQGIALSEEMVSQGGGGGQDSGCVCRPVTGPPWVSVSTSLKQEDKIANLISML